MRWTKGSRRAVGASIDASELMQSRVQVRVGVEGTLSSASRMSHSPSRTGCREAAGSEGTEEQRRNAPHPGLRAVSQSSAAS